MSVQFKLVQQGGQTRRLSFQERPTWLALATKIESLFGIPAENVAVSYIDNDDDEVTLSSHEELHDFYTTGAFHDHDVNKFTVKDLNAIRSSVRTPPTSVPGHSAQDSLLGERIENLAMPSFLMQEDEDWQTIPGLPGVFGGMAPKSPGRAMTPPFVEVVESEEGTAKRSATVSESGAEDDDQTNDASLYTTEDKGKGRAKDPKAASVEDDVSSTGSEIGGEQAPKPPVHIVDHNSSVHGSPQLVRLAEPQTVHMETDALPPNVPILENRRPQSPFNVDDWKPPAPQKPLSPAETVKPFPSFVAWSVEQPSQPTAPTAEPRNVETPAQEQQQPPERARDLDSPRSRQPAWGWRLDYADAETVHHPAPPSRGLFGPPTPPPVGTWSAGPPFVPPFPPRTAQAVPEQAPAAPAPAATTQASAQQPSLINDVAALLSGLTDAFASHPELSEGLRNIIRNAAEGTYWANEREQVMSSARQAAQAMHGPVEAQAEAGRKVAEALGSVFRALGSAASPPAAPRPPLGPRITRVSPSTAAQTDATPASLRNSRAIDFARESDDFTQIPGAWGSSAEPPRRKPYDPTANWHSGWSGRPGPSARDRWPPAPRWYGPPVAEARRFGQDVDPNDWPSSSSVGHGHHSHGPHGPRKHNHRHHIPPPPPPPPMFHNDPFFGHMPPPPPPPGPHGPFPPPPMPPPPPGMLGRPHVPGAPPVPGAGRPAPIIPSPASSRSVSPAPIPGAMPSSSTVRNNQEVVERPAEGGDVDMIEGNGEKDPYERARQRKVQLELAKEKYKQERGV
ncbi:hypothetical protein SISSUDRAFT_276635 [Sistotremastrum suecicum HHB10207 ss-3]|uniref:PB1 domain-containing protein n=1 Tax=Sistotremastrum suecicum HHB10207 ss-3 TaxID=1314776 RepID=A0A165ZM03_9AGAM|nr:hypothetical protein SISSUDRAFT_276635 [Sistotremastrum suecicum HHB10207 ss-3]